MSIHRFLINASIDFNTRSAHGILDYDKRLIGILAGKPQCGNDLEEVEIQAANAILEAAGKYHFAPTEMDHRRGLYGASAFGYGHGGGTTVRAARYLNKKR